jgi:hypothetical protein
MSAGMTRAVSNFNIACFQTKIKQRGVVFVKSAVGELRKIVPNHDFPDLSPGAERFIQGNIGVSWDEFLFCA